MPKTNTGLAVRLPKEPTEKPKINKKEAWREFRKLNQKKVEAWVSGREYDMTRLNQIKAILNCWNK